MIFFCDFSDFFVILVIFFCDFGEGVRRKNISDLPLGLTGEQQQSTRKQLSCSLI